MDTAEQELMINEVNILKTLDHPNIVQIYEYFEDQTYFFIVTELVQGGQLFDEITRRGKFNERDAATVIK
jgi:calcium-dependent protein kinase